MDTGEYTGEWSVYMPDDDLMENKIAELSEEFGRERDKINREEFFEEMHDSATVYETAAMKLFIDGNIHDGHSAMSNANALRTAANLMDGNACNGG